MADKEKILIIESDTNFADQTSTALQNNGYSTMVVKNGMEGVKTIYDITPQLILLDISLPDVDAYEILAKKDNDPVIAKIPLFLVSSQGVPINMRRVPAGSVVEFIMALHTEPSGIIEKVNRFFGHEVTRAPSSRGGATKVMWVEDDKLIGTILSRKLVSSGFDLFHAKTGEEALEALKDVKPDAIVLDLLLPGIGGFEVLQAINKDNGLRNVPVMILSNLSKPTDIDRAKILGAKRFLIKAATSLEQIVKEINALVGK
jgi:CheY-like chemotaxis protein